MRLGFFKQNWCVSAIITIVFFLFFFLFFRPIYETNDDVFFTLFANGNYTKNPSYYFQMNFGIQTVHIVFGKILVYLYSKAAHINWYTIILYTVAFLGVYSLVVPLINQHKNKTVLLFSLLILFVFLIRLLLFLSFTSIAMIGTVGGVFLFLHTYQYKKTSTYYLISIITLLLSQLIRQGSFVLILVCFLPVLAFYFIKNKSKLLIAFIFICFFSVIIVRVTNISAYQQSDAWKEKKDFFIPLSNFFYAPNLYRYENHVNLYKSVKWSRNDYLIFNSFFYDDERIFQTSHLQKITDTIKNDKFQISAFKTLPLYIFITVLSTFEYVLVLSFILAVGYRYIKPDDRKQIVYSGFTILILVIYFLYLGYLPGRIILSLIFYYCYLLIFFISTTAVSFKKTEQDKLLLQSVFLASLLLVLGSSLFAANNTNKKKIENIGKIVETISSDKHNLTMIWGSSIPYEWQSVFSTYNDYKERNFLISSWTQRSPLNNSIKKRFKIDNLYEAIYKNNNVFLIANEYQKKLLKVFIKEHYQQDITFVVVKDYSMYQFKSQLLKVTIKK